MFKIYLIIPLIGILAFGYVYQDFDKKHEERVRSERVEARLKKEREMKAEHEAREKSIADALRLQSQRTKEREERLAREASQKEARQNAIDAREKAYRETVALDRQIEKVKKEVAVEEKAVSVLVVEQKAAVGEQEFLNQYIKEATENVRAREALLESITAAEAAIAKAAAAAAAAAAQQKK
ncbi:MAG: hypothetical protein LBV54_07235 [Puniceicoccales bacterium]|jgi:hypothetical protein|nr:hypothetical protein [Puniceicoccales bacterium]